METLAARLPSQATRSTPARISLDAINQESIVAEDYYKSRLKEYQLALVKLQLRLAETARRSIILVFEGPDAAGKGGAIKRVVEKLDPRVVRVYSTVKPTTEELARHYLWRFWTRLPKRGQIAVFDRSWYGRVLVERVEGFASETEWRRAYREINEFERWLLDDNTIILKFYVHISKDEQLHRFKLREADPLKRWKINAEDWRNRDKWEQHNAAAEEMFERTSPSAAPWTVIAGNYKWHARLETLRTVVTTLEAAEF
ncbi:MAG: UDP-galactose-lipid carrier transferase [Verrucomicrobia bacterium]|nr:UDP-galactose-lipid carrier transferase [Verrucomicrobiota bacterium]